MPEQTGVPEVDDFLAAVGGEPPVLPERLGRDTGTGVPEVDDFLATVGVTQGDPERFKPVYALDAARQKLKGTPLSTSQAFRRDYMPLSDLTSLNSLPDLPKALQPGFGALSTVNGVKQFGGRVVGNAEYGRAAARFKEGKATQDDIEAIATYEHANEATEKVKKDLGFGGKLVQEVGGLGKIGAEMMVGGKIIGGVAGRFKGAAAAAAPPGVAPAIPISTWGQSLRGHAAAAGLKVPQLAMAPAFYVPMAQQKNMENGWRANDPRGYPTAVTYGYANLVVLGRLQKGLSGSVLSEGAKKGMLGAAELQIVDTMAGVADKFLPKAYQFDTKFGTVGQLTKAYSGGTDKEKKDALEHAAVQVVAFGTFAALHRGVEGRSPEAPENLMTAFAKTVDALAKSGRSKKESGKVVEGLHAKLEAELERKPYLTRAEVADLYKNDAPELKAYGEKLADLFSPRPVPPPEAPAPAPAPQPAAAATPAAPTPPPLKTPAQVLAEKVRGGPPPAGVADPFAANAPQPAKPLSDVVIKKVKALGSVKAVDDFYDSADPNSIDPGARALARQLFGNAKPAAPTAPSPVPEPGQTATQFADALRAKGLPPEYVKSMVEGHFPEAGPAPGDPLKPPGWKGDVSSWASPAPKPEAPRPVSPLEEKVNRVTAEYQAAEADLLAKKVAELKAGGNPKQVNQRYKDRRKRLREATNLDGLRDQLQKEKANPPAAAATPVPGEPKPAPPEIAPEAPKIESPVETPVVPPEPVIEAKNDGSAKKAGRLSVSAGRDGGKDMQGNSLTQHDILGEGGEVVGEARVFLSGATLRVDWIGAKGMAGGEGRGQNPFGAREVLRLIPELARAYPDAIIAKYTPSEGRINAGAAKEIDLIKVREKHGIAAPVAPRPVAPWARRLSADGRADRLREAEWGGDVGRVRDFRAERKAVAEAAARKLEAEREAEREAKKKAFKPPAPPPPKKALGGENPAKVKERALKEAAEREAAEKLAAAAPRAARLTADGAMKRLKALSAGGPSRLRDLRAEAVEAKKAVAALAAEAKVDLPKGGLPDPTSPEGQALAQKFADALGDVAGGDVGKTAEFLKFLEVLAQAKEMGIDFTIEPATPKSERKELDHPDTQKAIADAAEYAEKLIKERGLEETAEDFDQMYGPVVEEVLKKFPEVGNHYPEAVAEALQDRRYKRETAGLIAEREAAAAAAAKPKAEPKAEPATREAKKAKLIKETEEVIGEMEEWQGKVRDSIAEMESLPPLPETAATIAEAKKRLAESEADVADLRAKIAGAAPKPVPKAKAPSPELVAKTRTAIADAEAFQAQIGELLKTLEGATPTPEITKTVGDAKAALAQSVADVAFFREKLGEDAPKTEPAPPPAAAAKPAPAKGKGGANPKKAEAAAAAEKLAADLTARAERTFAGKPTEADARAWDKDVDTLRKTLDKMTAADAKALSLKLTGKAGKNADEARVRVLEHANGLAEHLRAVDETYKPESAPEPKAPETPEQELVRLQKEFTAETDPSKLTAIAERAQELTRQVKGEPPAPPVTPPPAAAAKAPAYTPKAPRPKTPETPVEERDRLQKVWDELTAAERKLVPGVGVRLGELGGNNAKKATPAVRRQLTSGENVDAETQKMLDEASFDADGHQQRAIEMLLAGNSTDFAGEKLGVSGTTVANRAERAFRTLKAEFPDKLAAYEKLQDWIRAEGEKREAAALEGQEELVKSAEEEVLDREAFERGEGEEDRGGARDWGRADKDGWTGGFMSREGGFFKFLTRLGGGESAGSVAAKIGKLVGGFPDAIKRLDAKRKGMIAAYAADMAAADRDIHRALTEVMRGDRSKLRARIDALITPPVAPEALQKIMKDFIETPGGTPEYAAARDAVPGPLRAPLEAFRTQVDRLSDLLIESGAIPEKLIPTVVAGRGTYLTRAYRIFLPGEAPKWVSEIPEDTRNRFVSVTAAAILKAEGTAATPERLQGILDEVLFKGTAAESPLAFIAKTKLGAKDLSILKPRGEIIPELRALWGEVTDPLAAYAITVAKQSHLLANHLFLSAVARAGESVGIYKDREAFRKANPDTVGVELADPSDTRFSPLAGRVGPVELKAAFDEAFSPRNVSTAGRVWMGFLLSAKYSKTVLSHAGWAGNFLGNVSIAVRNGYWRVGHFGEAVKTTFRDTAEARAFARVLTEKGVLGEGVHEREFNEVAESVFGKERAELDRQGYDSIVSPRQLLAVGRKMTRMAAAGYRAMDSVWKVYGFLNEASRYQKAYPEWSKEQVYDKAAEVVRDTQPTYSLIPRPIRGLKVLPIAPFVNFTSEVARNTYHAFKLAFTEIADPRTRSIGYTRLAGLAAAATGAWALAMATRSMTGTDDEKEEAMRRLGPEYDANSKFLHMGKNEKGDPTYMNLSRLDAHAAYLDAFVAASRPGTPGERARRAADVVSKPFLAEELVVRAGLDVGRNSREGAGGSKVYNPQDTDWEKAKDVGEHLLQPFVPGSYSSGRKAYMASKGQVEQKTGKEYRPEEQYPAQVAIRPLTLERSKGLQGKAMTFLEGKKDAAKLLSDMIKAKGVVSDVELTDARNREEAARKKVFEEFKKDVDAAVLLGMDKGEVNRVLKAAGVSDEDRGAVWSGRYRPLVVEPPAVTPLSGPVQRARAQTVRTGKMLTPEEMRQKALLLGGLRVPKLN